MIHEINGQRYEIGTMPAFTQLHVARRIGTVIQEIEAAKFEMYQDGTLTEMIDGEQPLLHGSRIMQGMVRACWRAMGAMTQENAEAVMHDCLSVVTREQPNGDWAKVLSGKQPMFADMKGQTMLQLVVVVVKENLADFFPLLQGTLDSSESADTSETGVASS